MATLEADPSPAGPSGSSKLSVPASVRRDSSSSYSSDAYSPLPPGRWNLNLHGNCSRCHHHHSFARFKVNIPSNPNITTHVRCQGCHAKWLAIGGRNATQLSLLSVNSITPDPAADTLRYSLVNMVRTTTALATLSPVLAGIAEYPASPTPSRQHSTRTAQVDQTRVDSPSKQIPGGSMRPTQSGNSIPIEMPGSVSFPPLPSVRPITTQKYGLLTGRHISHLKESMGMRFPAFHRANLRTRFGITKPQKMSVKRWGKQPISTPMVAEHTKDSDRALDLSLSGDSAAREPEPGRAYASRASAIQFLQNLANDTTQLASMTEKEKAAWVRAKNTEFKDRSVGVDAAPTTSSDIASGVGDLTPQLVQLAGATSCQGQRSGELFGLGSHLEAFDELRPRDSFSISERTSEAETAVDDATAMPQPQYSLLDFLQRERRGSGSPRPHSVAAFTLQRLRRGRREVGFSMDSAVIGEARRSFSRPRSPATDRYSQSSTIRTSMLSGTQLNMSQTSLASH